MTKSAVSLAILGRNRRLAELQVYDVTFLLVFIAVSEEHSAKKEEQLGREREFIFFLFFSHFLAGLNVPSSHVAARRFRRILLRALALSLSLSLSLCLSLTRSLAHSLTRSLA